MATLDVQSEWPPLPAINLTSHLLSLPELPSVEIRPTQEASITAIIPLQTKTLSDLEHTLRFLMSSHGALLSEVVLVYPEPLLVAIRKTVRQIMSLSDFWSHSPMRVQLTLHPWLSNNEEDSMVDGVLHAAWHISGGTILIFGEVFSEELFDVYIPPTEVTFPIGSRGFSGQGDGHVRCLLPSSEPTPALFLVPPFLIPARLLSQHPPETSFNFKSWLSFGAWVAQGQPGAAGGVVSVGEAGVEKHQEQLWCGTHSLPDDLLDSTSVPDNLRVQTPLLPVHTPATRGFFGLVVTSLEDLVHFSSAACRMVAFGHSLHILYISPNLDPRASDFGTSGTHQCDLHFTVQHATVNPNIDDISIWFDDIPGTLDILITIKEDLHPTLYRASQQHDGGVLNIIALPRADLQYCDWMGALDLQEWRNWHVPQVEISIITDSRPSSLTRLLRSLGEARYFGDCVNLRVNIEQTAGRETIQLVDGFEWEHGPTFVHHRVVHGGLLPAVVEAWYPRSNDSYGILLEDDVELSPLFFAWTKLAILRYRYGREKHQSQGLFGVSLYQQKNVELRPEGRIPFNARQLFSTAGLPHSNTPYLSQIPCSWGAVYFPEHWREFHDYLSIRLPSSQANPPSSFPLDANIVPDVRSNKWVHSWKRYFIEIVFLRGYTMLYPNFAGFHALSTNHLEAGAHVKPIPRAVYAKKKALFEVPLLPLPVDNTSNVLVTGLLDLPDARLPLWRDLPVLDLHGELTSEVEIARRGKDRLAEFHCLRESAPYNVHDFLCQSSQDIPSFDFPTTPTFPP
ncbi:hypothetical protein OF83DRAFT_1052265 [Amylostereum chailletii]|nr:hypothetical protein OF83DRAFT_1052265 [Amylostereum chailletii]